MYYCGWDGGGTKTEICVLSGEKEQLACASFGALNINGASRETVEETVRRGVAYMADRPEGLSGCAALVIGFAGASNRHAAGLIENAVRSAGYQGKLVLMGDQEIALAGAVEGHGAVLIAGTGAICFGRDREMNRFRVGGYGYLIDDGGSGYAIGRDILSAVVRSLDGREGPTRLKDMVFDFLGVSDAGGVITWLYGPETGKKEVASLAPLLLRALEEGDAAAEKIARKAAAELAELAVAAWRKTGMEDGELALTGSILNRYPPIRQRFEAIVREKLPHVNIISPRGSSALGAALLAMES